MSEAIAGAVIDPSRWVRAMDVIAEQTGSIGAFLAPVEGKIPNKIVSDSIVGLSETYFSEEWFREDIRLRPTALATFMEKGVFDERDYTSLDEIRTHPYFRDLLDRFDLRWSATLKMTGGDDLWGIGIQRSIEQGAFSTDELAKLSRFSDHLSVIGAAAKALGFANIKATMRAYEVSGAPVMLLDRKGRVIRINPAAERMLGGDVQVSEQRVRLSNKVAARALDKALHALFWNTGERAALVQTVVIPRDGRMPLLAYPTRLPEAAHDALALAQGILVFKDPEVRLMPSVVTLKESFGLTDAEARLAINIALGKTLEEVAVANSIAPVTARNQLSAAMRKMGVRRQPELVAIMSSMAPNIAIGSNDR